MIKSITLQNFKSFGEAQTVPLEPITVLVGPNNSGKSNFMSVGRFMRNAQLRQLKDAIDTEGGHDDLVFRPRRSDESTIISWTTDDGHSERLEILDREKGKRAPYAMDAVKTNPFITSSSVVLRVDAMRKEALISPRPSLDGDGNGIAAVVAGWRNSLAPQATLLDQLVSRALPEIAHVLARFSETPGHARLVVQQRDGEVFDAHRLSDGVLFFLGLAVHVLIAPADNIIFIEEPETGIHPRRLKEVVDLLRTVAYEGRQIILSTHSPTLLDAFRSEPESIVLFRRGPNGTQVKRLSDVPELLRAIDDHDARPGEMLADGFFNDPF